MISSAQPTRGSRRIAILAVAMVLPLVMIGALDRVRSVQARLTDTEVPYEECRVLLAEMDERDVVRKECLAQGLDRISQPRARYSHCGIDEALTRTACEKRLRTEALRREAERNRRALTPVEEQQVLEHIEEQYLGDKVSSRRTELQQFLHGVRDRLGNLLTTQSYNFTNIEKQQLDDAKTLVASLTAEYDRGDVTKQDIRVVRDELSPLLTEIQAMLTQKQRSVPADGPRIENLVVRVDDLVARVGTVIRDLERAGERVPQAVRSGHRSTLQLVREAKQTCSTSRPDGCRQLWEVLEILETMRVPLCAIDSSVINFCN